MTYILLFDFFSRIYQFWTFVRYKNILPYDHTRITLKEAFIYPGTEDEKCDYINASWITNSDGGQSNGNKSNSTRTRKLPDPCSNISFMACQGPTPVTCHYHLQMIHEQRADIVVMLTRLVETAGQGIFWISNDNQQSLCNFDFTYTHLVTIRITIYFSEKEKMWTILAWCGGYVKRIRADVGWICGWVKSAKSIRTKTQWLNPSHIRNHKC